MRIDVLFVDRVGIAQEILAELAGRQLNVTAVEVEPPHVSSRPRRLPRVRCASCAGS